MKLLFTNDREIISNRRSPDFGICWQSLTFDRPDPCDEPFDVKVKGRSFYNFLPLSFTMWVNWGDGTPLSGNDPNLPSGNYYPYLGWKKFKHTYSSPGDYTVVSQLTTECPLSNFPVGIPKILFLVKKFKIELTCDPYQKSESIWMQQGDYAVSGEAWSIKDWFGSWAGAKTRAFRFDKGKWRRYYADKLENTIYARFRDDAFNLSAVNGDQDECNHCRWETNKVRSKGDYRYHRTGDVKATFGGDLNELRFDGDITLKYNCD